MFSRNSKAKCFVPSCKNSVSSTPKKLFISVPKNEPRKRWLEAVNRWYEALNFTLYASRIPRWCCEDHFKFDEDVENWDRIKHTYYFHPRPPLLKLKPGIVPHIFNSEHESFERRNQMLACSKMSEFDANPKVESSSSSATTRKASDVLTPQEDESRKTDTEFFFPEFLEFKKEEADVKLEAVDSTSEFEVLCSNIEESDTITKNQRNIKDPLSLPELQNHSSNETKATLSKGKTIRVRKDLLPQPINSHSTTFHENQTVSQSATILGGTYGNDRNSIGLAPALSTNTPLMVNNSGLYPSQPPSDGMYFSVKNGIVYGGISHGAHVVSNKVSRQIPNPYRPTVNTNLNFCTTQFPPRLVMITNLRPNYPIKKLQRILPKGSTENLNASPPIPQVPSVRESSRPVVREKATKQKTDLISHSASHRDQQSTSSNNHSFGFEDSQSEAVPTTYMDHLGQRQHIGSHILSSVVVLKDLYEENPNFEKFQPYYKVGAHMKTNVADIHQVQARIEISCGNSAHKRKS